MVGSQVNTVHKFKLDWDTTATLQMGYQPARNLQPYKTAEKAFYGRDGQRSLNSLSVEAEARYQQRKESYTNLINLLKEYNLHKSIIPVKKNVDNTWITFQPAGVKLNVEGLTFPSYSSLPDVIHYAELFSYDIVEEAIDHENVYDGLYYRTFGIKDEQQVKYSTDFGEYHYLNQENTVNLVKLLAQMRDVTATHFEAKGKQMTHQDFANILILTVLNVDHWISGTPKQWVKYVTAGLTLNEVIYAFNRYNWEQGRTTPIPASILKEYMGLPVEWMRKMLTP